MESSLVNQCMAFCQTLATNGMALSFHIKIGNTFSFSLETKKMEQKIVKPKKISPSQQRRNMKQCREFFDKKKNLATSTSPVLSAVSLIPAMDPKAGEEPDRQQCDQWDYTAGNRHALMSHTRRHHKTNDRIPQTDGIRDNLADIHFPPTRREEEEGEGSVGGGGKGGR